MNRFKREERYIVWKIRDLMESEVTQAELDAITAIRAKVDGHRARRGAGVLDPLVVENDWPEFEPTWAAIEARSRGTTIAEPAPAGAAFGIIDPDYARIYTQARIVAWQYGYSCCAQGSFTRDLDLLLVPWTEYASPNIEVVVNHLADVAGLRVNGPAGDKPHGRKAWTLLLPGFTEVRWVDVSTFPLPGQKI